MGASAPWAFGGAGLAYYKMSNLITKGSHKKCWSATVAQTGSLRRLIMDPSVRPKPFRALLGFDQCPIIEL
jgi:hypothetical protein